MDVSRTAGGLSMHQRLFYIAALCACLPFAALAEQPMNQFATVIDNQFQNYADNLSASHGYKALSDSGLTIIDFIGNLILSFSIVILPH